MGELNWLTAEDMAQGFGSGVFSPVNVVGDCLAQIAAWEPRLNALTLVDGDGARTQAEKSAARWQAGRPLSPLDGARSGEGYPSDARPALPARVVHGGCSRALAR